jgi:hypothetical protein
MCVVPLYAATSRHRAFIFAAPRGQFSPAPLSRDKMRDYWNRLRNQARRQPRDASNDRRRRDTRQT